MAIWQMRKLRSDWPKVTQIGEVKVEMKSTPPSPSVHTCPRGLTTGSLQQVGPAALCSRCPAQDLAQQHTASAEQASEGA